MAVLSLKVFNFVSIVSCKNVIDRVILKEDEDFYNRLADAIQMAFYEGKGTLFIEHLGSNKISEFNNRFERDGMTFTEPNVHLFSFNNPFGACPTCEGYGDVVGVDQDLVIPNTSLSIYENAIFPWRGDSMGWYRDQLVNSAYKFDFPIHKPWFELTKTQQQLVWDGNEHFEGLHSFFKYLESKSYKIQNRVMLSRYRGKTKCHTCHGKRLRVEANYVKINDKMITDLVTLPLDELSTFFKNINLTKYEEKVAKRLLVEIKNRLKFLNDVGLNYLTLNRPSNTLSGGESQRINLATSLGSSLVGSMYILDEPSIGLHQRDNEKLIKTLFHLKSLGNTVIVVEHDEEAIRCADHIIDIGPGAGKHGGEICAQGSLKDILKSKESMTAAYLSGKRKIDFKKTAKVPEKFIEIQGAYENNLQNISVKIPVGVFTCVTGVSGSGKSSLINQTLMPMSSFLLNKANLNKEIKCKQIHGLENLDKVIGIDQSPIGRTPRSNPATYTGLFSHIRDLFSQSEESRTRGYKPGRFSFNVKGGRCEACQGDGMIKVEMHFLADIYVNCDICNSKRYNEQTLEVKYKGKNIAEVLGMTVEEALDFFSAIPAIKNKLQTLSDVGLTYITLGQSATTLSGGEAQRIKLAKELSKRSTGKTLFILDEPTTGLHFYDIELLLGVLKRLADQGNTVVVIEHNLDVIKSSDWVIDLGPEGGSDGGLIVAEGSPEKVAQSKKSYTGKYLKEII